MYIPLLLIATAMETGIATSVINTGSQVGNLGAAAILGIVSLGCVYALVQLYRDKQKENTSMLTILTTTIEKNTEAITRNGEVIGQLTKSCLAQQMNSNVRYAVEEQRHDVEEQRYGASEKRHEAHDKMRETEDQRSF